MQYEILRLTAENMDKGMSPVEARKNAIARVGFETEVDNMQVNKTAKAYPWAR